MSDTIAVMNDGRIIQRNTPNNIYNCPNSIFVADFIGSGNFIPVSSVVEANGGTVLKIMEESDIFLKSNYGKSYKRMDTLPDFGYLNKGFVPPFFFIRPEKIKISGEESRVSRRDGTNLYRGTVKSIIFEGPDIKVGVQNPVLGNMKIEIKNDGSGCGFREGQEIFFYWNPSDGLLLEC